MRMHKEQIWLGMAFLTFLFLFERSDTLIVQDGQVCVNQRKWWFDEKKILTINASSIESVTHISKWGKSSKVDSLLLKDKKGSVFYELHYSGFKIGANWWDEVHHDEIKCKDAIAGNGKFSREVSTVSPIPYVMLIVSLVVFVYKYSWRIHCEREDKQHMCNSLAELSSTLGIAKSGSVVSSIKAKSHQSHTSTTRNNQRALRNHGKQQVAVTRRKEEVHDA